MENILKILIDFSLFEKYDKEYFISNKIVPICEDSISLKVAVCKNSDLSNIKEKFSKLISFVEADELDILFLLSNLDKKIYLYKIAVGTHPIWPPRAFTFGQLTHNDLASVRIPKRATKSL